MPVLCNGGGTSLIGTTEATHVRGRNGHARLETVLAACFGNVRLQTDVECSRPVPAGKSIWTVFVVQSLSGGHSMMFWYDDLAAEVWLCDSEKGLS